MHECMAFSSSVSLEDPLGPAHVATHGSFWQPSEMSRPFYFLPAAEGHPVRDWEAQGKQPPRTGYEFERALRRP